MSENQSAIGRSSAFQTLQSYVEIAARYDVPVLLEGETGSGKEIAARSIHYTSARASKPFVPVNCGALPDTLVENELFGHQRGAYTDAKEDSPGLIGVADGGTLFLDELEALAPRGQTALLRFLDTKEVRPVGGKRTRKADVRIICATNVNLRDLVQQGAIRQDLYYRVAVLAMLIPPLRDRGDDVLILAEHFKCRYEKRYCVDCRQFAPGTKNWMLRHTWPGNIRELDNFVHRQLLLAQGGEISLEGYSDTLLRAPRKPCAGVTTSNGVALDSSFNERKASAIAEFERDYLREVMTRSHGNVTQAARLAGKERRTLGKLLKKHGLNSASFG